MAWDSKDLREDLAKLRKMYSKEKDIATKEKLIDVIHSTMLSICECEVGEFGEIDEKIDNITILFNSIPRFTMYYPTIYKFLNVLNKTDYDYPYGDGYVYEARTELSRDDMFSLCHDFFKSCGKKIYGYYSKMEKEQDKYLNLLDELGTGEGNTYSVPFLNKRYIWVGTEGSNKDMLSTLTHEYGHGIATFINPFRYANNDFFIEIESLFFEYIGLDYYYHATNDPFYKNYLEDMINYNYWEARKIIALKKSNDKTFNFMTDEESANKLCNRFMRKEKIDFGSINPERTMKYLFSYIIAVELFETYKEDKELAFNLLEKIVNRDNTLTEYESIYNTVEPVKSLVKHVNRFKRS